MASYLQDSRGGDGSAPIGVTVTAEQGNDTIEVPPAP